MLQHLKWLGYVFSWVRVVIKVSVRVKYIITVINYRGNSVLLENKPLMIESIGQYIRVPSRIFSISSLVKILPNFRTLPKIFRKF